MSGKRYTDEFKIGAVKQVTERGYSVADVAQRLGITIHSLYAWKVKFDRPELVQQAELNQHAEIRRLKAELKRMTEERDILVPSMSRRGNCHDNAVAESLFSALKKERIKRCISPNRTTATSEVFDYLEMFFKPIRRHDSAGDLSPVEFEKRYALNGL